MILYFCDKKLHVYGCLSNRLPDSPIESDQLTKDIDSTVATLELTLDYTAQTRAELEQWTMPGCYILMRYDDGKDYVFQIIDAELDTGNMAIEVTAEDAGLELLNVECLIYPDEEQGDTKDPQTLTWYVTKWIKGSGFEIGVNESSNTNKKALTFDSEQTATERLKEVASKFDMEIDYSFAIDGLKITHKYVNIHKKIGADNGVRLYAGRNLSSITVKRSIENLATCLLVYGSTPDGGLGPLTLDGYAYNDGEYYVDGHYVKSKTAVEKWGIITRTFEYDTTDQQTLLSEAIKELKTRADVEVNYEVDVVDAPENIHVGDTVGIVDDAGGLYLSARILKMERSIIDHSTKLTIGNYLIKTAGLSATVRDMAKTFQIMKSSTKVVSDVQQMYCLSDSVDSSSGGTWTTQMPELMDDQHYLWTKTVVSYTDGYTSESAPVLAAAINGAANTATRYVTAQTESGQILVHPEGDTKNAVLIGQDVQIIRNGVTVATYSDAVKIGNANSGHTEISPNEQKFIADDGTIVLDTLRDTSRVYTMTETAYTEDTEGQNGSYVNKAKLSYPMYKLVGIYARNGTDITKDVTYTYDSSTYTLKNMSNADSDGDPMDMKYSISIKYIPDIDNVTMSVGRYPLADNRGKLFVLGNGVSNADRRNVLDVDMLGNLKTVGNITASGKIYGDFSYTNGEHALIPPDMTYDKFSNPDVYKNRVTNESGGFYKCGRYVYVYMVCKAAIAFNNAAAFTGLPAPASKYWANSLMPLTAVTADGLTVPCYINPVGSLCMTVAKDKWVIVNGYYFSASM